MTFEKYPAAAVKALQAQGADPPDPPLRRAGARHAAVKALPAQGADPPDPPLRRAGARHAAVKALPAQGADPPDPPLRRAGARHAAVKDAGTDTVAAASVPRPRGPAGRRSARLPKISTLAATVGVGLAGATGAATLAACSSSAPGSHPQPSVSSSVSAKAAAHTVSPSDPATARTLKPPATYPAAATGHPHATSSAS